MQTHTDTETQTSSSTTRREDLALMEACFGGSREAWGQLVVRHQKTVRHTIMKTCSRFQAHYDDAFVDDMESTVFMRIADDGFDRLRKFRGGSSLNTWIGTVARNATIDALRRRRKEVSPDELEETGELPSTFQSPYEAAEERQLRDRMHELCESMIDEDRRFIELFIVQELSFEEISELTGATVGALYARKNRITHKLRDACGADGWFDAAMKV